MMDDMLTEMRLASDAIDRLYGTQLRRNDALQAEIDKLWSEVAALRDETHEAIAAVTNRQQAAFRCSPDESGGLRDAS